MPLGPTILDILSAEVGGVQPERCLRFLIGLSTLCSDATTVVCIFHTLKEVQDCKVQTSIAFALFVSTMAASILKRFF